MKMSKERYNQLLSDGPKGAEHVEYHQETEGEEALFAIYFFGDKKIIRNFETNICTPWLQFKSFKDIDNNWYTWYLLTHDDGSMRFYRLSDGKESSCFQSFADLQNGWYLLTDSDVNMQFFRLSDGKETDCFKSFADLQNGWYLLKCNDNDVRFFRSSDGQESTWFKFFESFGDLQNGWYLLTQFPCSRHLFRLSDGKESSSFESFEDLKNGWYLLTDSDGYMQFFRLSDGESVLLPLEATFQNCVEGIKVISRFGTVATFFTSEGELSTFQKH